MDLFQGCWQEATERLSGMWHTLWPFIFLIHSPPTLQRSWGTWGSGPRAPPLSLVGLDYPFIQNMGAHWEWDSLIAIDTWDLLWCCRVQTLLIRCCRKHFCSISPVHGAGDYGSYWENAGPKARSGGWWQITSNCLFQYLLQKFTGYVIISLMLLRRTWTDNPCSVETSKNSACIDE